MDNNSAPHICPYNMDRDNFTLTFTICDKGWRQHKKKNDVAVATSTIVPLLTERNLVIEVPDHVYVLVGKI